MEHIDTGPGDPPGSAPPSGINAGRPPSLATGVQTSLKSLSETLRTAKTRLDTGTGAETASEEDYDENVRPVLTKAAAGLRHRRKGRGSVSDTQPGRIVRSDSGIYIVPDDERGILAFLKRSSQRVGDGPHPTSRRGKFADLVFTHQFSAFDPNNETAYNSPFHGFYTLFWLAVALFVFKISAENWRTYGNPLGSNDIMKTMFRRDGRS